jgi:hypothetical protein
MRNWLLLILCMIMMTSLTSAASSPPSNTANLSTLNATVVEKALELAGLQKERLASYGQWPPFLYFETAEFKFNYSQNVEGGVSPVRSQDRDLGSYAAIYKKYNPKSALNPIVGGNLEAEERTSALEGNYKSEESLGVTVNDGVILGWMIFPQNLAKLIDYGLTWNELSMTQSHISWDKSTEYSGKGINNLECYLTSNPREYLGSSNEKQQYVNTNFLYNKELTKESKSSLNTGIDLLSDDFVYMDELGFRTKGDLNYSLNSHSSGIADINYGKVEFQQQPIIPTILKTKPGSMYKVEGEGQERYVGDFDISKNIQMSSSYERMVVSDNWIPCCAGGWNTMPQLYQAAIGKDTKGVFDCTCYKAPNVAQFPRIY